MGSSPPSGSSVSSQCIAHRECVIFIPKVNIRDAIRQHRGYVDVIMGRFVFVVVLAVENHVVGVPVVVPRDLKHHVVVGLPERGPFRKHGDHGAFVGEHVWMA